MRRIVMFLTLFTGILVSTSFAQTQKLLRDSIFFTGVVMDQKDLIPLPNTHFRINNEMAGTANQYGRFSFWVNPGDTVKYSYVGYQDVKLIISDSLQQEKYLFGVFMPKDTVALQEVLILPRFGDFREAFVNAKVNTPEYVRAKNNINSATYEALTTKPETMDAKANTDMVLKRYQIKNEYRTMIPPDMMISVSLSRTLPEVQRMKRKRKMEIKDELITDREINILKSMYEHHIRDQK